LVIKNASPLFFFDGFPILVVDSSSCPIVVGNSKHSVFEGAFVHSTRYFQNAEADRRGLLTFSFLGSGRAMISITNGAGDEPNPEVSATAYVALAHASGTPIDRRWGWY
jgi:hypothetical protein